MRSLAWFVFGFYLIAIQAGAATGAAKCQAEKNAMDQAWKNDEKADKNWEASLDPLIKAMEKKDIAEKAYKDATDAVKKYGDEYSQADRQWTNCIEKDIDSPKSLFQEMLPLRLDTLHELFEALPYDF